LTALSKSGAVIRGGEHGFNPRQRRSIAKFVSMRVGEAERRLFTAGFLLAQSGDAVHEPGNFTLRSVAVNDIFLRGANDHGLGLRHGGLGASAIAGGDCLFNFAHRSPQARTPRLIDESAMHGLACGLFGRFRIGHERYQVFVKRRL
jgi:hypothetical protein